MTSDQLSVRLDICRVERRQLQERVAELEASVERWRAQVTQLRDTVATRDDQLRETVELRDDALAEVKRLRPDSPEYPLPSFDDMKERG